MFNRSQIFNIICLCIVGLSVPAGLPVRAEPIYLLSESDTAETEEKPFHIEIQAGGIFSKGDITDNQGDVLSSWMYGVRGRVLMRVSDRILLGVGAEKLKTKDLEKVFLSSIERQVFCAVFKWIATPQTQPQIYLLSGVGYMREKTKFIMYQPPMKTQGLTIELGVGVQAVLWQNVGAAAEYVIYKDMQPWDNFVLKGPRFREELAGYLFYRF